jgi:hypothetical protein
MADVTIPASLVGTPANAVTRNAAIEAKIVNMQVAMLEFDLDGTLPVNSYLTMIPASLNKNGLMIVDMNAYATEVVASDAVDGVITVRDGASSPNTIDTLTVSNGDAVGDLTQWTKTEWEARVDGTDYSAYMVEAGVKVEAAVTTLASDAGTTTGKVLLMIRFFAIPSAE